jgi:hypothetical protein
VIGTLFPRISEEQRRNIYFALTYQMGGGGGMTWTKADVDNCSLGELFWYLDRLHQQRKDEAAKMKKGR